MQYLHACGRRIESPTFFALGLAFKALWDAEPWLHDYSDAVVRDTLKYQADAWKAFFAGHKGYPKWKNRYQTPSCTIPDDVRIKDGCLAVPKVGWLSLRRQPVSGWPAGQGRGQARGQALVRHDLLPGRRRTHCSQWPRHRC